MVKLKDIRRTPQDVKAEKKALGRDAEHAYVPPEDDGARFELEHHHLEKLNAGDLAHGDTVHFHGHGTVEQATSGERNRATIRFHHGAIEHTPINKERNSYDGSLKNDIAKSYQDSEAKASAKRAAKDKQIPEKT